MRSELFGTHPQPARYYVKLSGGTLRTMLDLEMLVVGSGLVGLAVAVLLDGLGVVEIGLALATGTMLGSALVLGVVGAFALGIATEGGYGASESVASYPALEIVVGRAMFGIAVSLGLLLVAGRLEPATAEMALPIRAGVEVLRTTGTVGVGVSLLGVPLVSWLRRGLDRVGWGVAVELPALYVLWVISVLAAYTVPAA